MNKEADAVAPVVPVWRMAVELWCRKYKRNGLSLPFILWMESKKRGGAVNIHDLATDIVNEMAEYPSPTIVTWCCGMKTGVFSSTPFVGDINIKGNLFTDCPQYCSIISVAQLNYDAWMANLFLYFSGRVGAECRWVRFDRKLLSEDETELLLTLKLIRKGKNEKEDA